MIRQVHKTETGWILIDTRRFVAWHYTDDGIQTLCGRSIREDQIINSEVMDPRHANCNVCQRLMMMKVAFK